jgi:hypothetical protein
MHKLARNLLLAHSALVLTSSAVLFFPRYAAAADTYPQQCAKRDLQAFLQIERHGEIGDVDPARVGKAFVTMLEARHLCNQHRVPEAFALYDGLFTDSMATTAKK